MGGAMARKISGFYFLKKCSRTGPSRELRPMGNEVFKANHVFFTVIFSIFLVFWCLPGLSSMYVAMVIFFDAPSECIKNAFSNHMPFFKSLHDNWQGSLLSFTPALGISLFGDSKGGEGYKLSPVGHIWILLIVTSIFGLCICDNITEANIEKFFHVGNPENQDAATLRAREFKQFVQTLLKNYLILAGALLSFNSNRTKPCV